MDNPELETLDYRAPTTEKLGKESYKSHHFEQPVCKTCKGFEDKYCVQTGTMIPCPNCKPEQPIEQLPGREHAKECECGHCPEQPNTNAILIKTIQQYMHVTTNALKKLREGITDQVPGDSCRKVRVLQALEDIDLFERTTLKELKQAFND